MTDDGEVDENCLSWNKTCTEDADITNASTVTSTRYSTEDILDSYAEDTASYTNDMLSRQCSPCELDYAPPAATDSKVDAWKLVTECTLGISVQDPRQPDGPFVAVSKEFEDMTGYDMDELVGRTSRLLLEDVPENIHHRMGLHKAISTGEQFTGLVLNHKRDGRPFLKLVDLRGLTIAHHRETGKELWLLIGIQADVSHILDDVDQDDFEERIPEIRKRLNARRMQATDKMAAMAFAGAQAVNSVQDPAAWELLATPEWR